MTANGLAFAGRTDENGVSGLIWDGNDGNEPGDFPTPEQLPDGVNDYIAVVARDRIVTFAEKVRNAQNTGGGAPNVPAAGVIIYNDLDEEFQGTLGEADNWVPVVSVSASKGSILLGAAGSGAVTVVNKTVDYGPLSGTSMATPHVAGIAGLLISLDPSMTHESIKSAILETVDSIPELSDKVATGGRVNALKALCSISAVQGDLSGDLQVDLADAILSFQILSDRRPATLSPCVAHGVDIGGNLRFGMEEPLYILQMTSGVR
jgi:subtilisin family serine protease